MKVFFSRSTSSFDRSEPKKSCEKRTKTFCTQVLLNVNVYAIFLDSARHNKNKQNSPLRFLVRFSTYKLSNSKLKRQTWFSLKFQSHCFTERHCEHQIQSVVVLFTFFDGLIQRLVFFLYEKKEFFE